MIIKYKSWRRANAARASCPANRVPARVAAMTEPGQALMSSTERDLVAGSGLRFRDSGLHELRGLPQQLHLYAVLTEG
jgi:class 3 adenylate cyclase